MRMRSITRRLATLAVVTAISIAGSSSLSFGGPTDHALQEFEASLRAGLPRCFSTTNLDDIGKELSSGTVRCAPIALSYETGDPFPWKLVCLSKDKFHDRQRAEFGWNLL